MSKRIQKRFDSFWIVILSKRSNSSISLLEFHLWRENFSLHVRRMDMQSINIKNWENTFLISYRNSQLILVSPMSPYNDTLTQIKKSRHSFFWWVIVRSRLHTETTLEISCKTRCNSDMISKMAVLDLWSYLGALWVVSDEYWTPNKSRFRQN